MGKHQLSRKLAVILHADVSDSTKLVRQDETLAHQRIQDTFRRFSETIANHDGVAQEIRGDALIAEFARASDAVDAALSYQASNAEHNEQLPDDIVPQLRIGIAMGEVVIADNTVTGEGVVLAQRLEQLAETGGVCIQGAAYETVPKRLPFEFKSLGEQPLKGFNEPVRVYSVSFKSDGNISGLDPHIKPQAMEAKNFPDEPSEIRPSIAVLPFDNMSGDPEQEYFADGITEDITTALSKIRSFLVIARNSSFTYKNQAVDTKTVAQELGVRYLLEGSVRKAGKRIRIAAQLIDAPKGHHVWAEHYDRELEDIFDLQDEITQTIAAAIEPELSAKEREMAARKSPDSLDAWESFQRAMWCFYGFEREKLPVAIEMFEKSIAADPAFAPSYAFKSFCHYAFVVLGWTDEPERHMTMSMDCAKKALALDPKDAAGYFALSRIQMIHGEHDDAIAAGEKAIELNPNAFYAYQGLAFPLVLAGRAEEGIELTIQAERISPRDPLLWSALIVRSLGCILLERYEEAIDYAEKASQIPVATGYWPHTLKASALAQAGRVDEARVFIQQAISEKPDLSIDFIVSTLPTKHKDGLRPYLEGLRKAGLPEE